MIKLLREDKVAPQFRRMCRSAKRASIAAPFWGEGAAELLAPGDGPALRVLCRFDSPACNPRALLELADAGAKIRSHPRLHAKIYLTPAAAIVGSSNPSRYGLTQEGDLLGGTVEANLLTDDPDVVGDLTALFQELWEAPESERIGRSRIIKEIARRDQLPRSAPPRAITAKSLLAACREAPDLFGSVLIAPYAGDLDPGGKQKLSEVQNGAATPDGVGEADFRNAWGYQFDEPPPDGAWLIDLDCKGKRARVRGTSRVPEPAYHAKVKGENDLTITVRGDVSVPGAIGTFRLSASEKAELEAIARRLLASRDFVTLPQAVAMIEASSSTAPRGRQRRIAT